ncbi:MAG: DUF4197 domain-containing protein [Chryseolinea sp.]
MKKFSILIVAGCFAWLAACTSAQINQTIGVVNKALESEAPLSNAEVGEGLKEALIKGVTTGADAVSVVDGYLTNSEIKIPFPPDVQKVESKLRQIGLGQQVDKFIITLNHGAEDAAKEAKPIFISAIKALTIQDAWAILNGGNDAATQFLKKTTTLQLTEKFKPVIQNSLNKVDATRYYGDIVRTYNAIPLTEDVNPNLEEYATQKAIDGLFVMIAREEKSIRQDPMARTSDLLRKVFGAQN